MDSSEQDFLILSDWDFLGSDSSGMQPDSIEEIEEMGGWLHPTDCYAASGEY